MGDESSKQLGHTMFCNSGASASHPSQSHDRGVAGAAPLSRLVLVHPPPTGQASKPLSCYMVCGSIVLHFDTNQGRRKCGKESPWQSSLRSWGVFSARFCLEALIFICGTLNVFRLLRSTVHLNFGTPTLVWLLN